MKAWLTMPNPELSIRSHFMSTLSHGATRANPRSLTAEEAGSEDWVDASSEALASQRATGIVGLEDIEGRMTDHRKIQGRIVPSGSAAILVEDHVHHPMQAVLDAPMRARGGEEGFRVWRERGDAKSDLDAFGAAGLVDSPGLP
jgi:hypothetical protein